MRQRLMHEVRRTSFPLAIALVLLVAAGCGSAESGGSSGGQTPEESTATDTPSPPGPGVLECGAAPGVTGGALTLSGRFPGSVAASAETVEGTVMVEAKGSEARGAVTPLAEAFLVRDGRIVTLPMAQDAVGRSLDLRDGKAEALAATATLVPCSGEPRLDTGTYELYVRVVLNNDDGSRVDSLGGPWPLEVR